MPNYPDVLGYVTQGKHTAVNVLQVATALRPRVVRAGRPFEMLMLIQNTTDVEMEVSATLQLPDKDAKGQKGRFVTKAGRLVFKLEPAAVGMVTLPLSSLPDTAAGNEYKIGMTLHAQPHEKAKPNRVRGNEEVPFDLSTLSEERRSLLEELKGLHWATNHSGSTMVSQLTVMSGTVGTLAELKPSWTNLWTLEDHTDKSFLFHKHGTFIQQRLIPQLTQKQVLPVIAEYTQKRFAKSKYKVGTAEFDMMNRLLTLMLLYASADPKKMVLMATGQEYNLVKYFDADYFRDPTNKLTVPHWLEKLLDTIVHDARVAEYPVKAIAHFALDALLRDAMLHAFARIEEQVDIELGSPAERSAYVDHFIQSLNQGKLDFELLYMPLVLGGVVVADQVLNKGEKPAELTQSMRSMIDARYPEKNDENAAMFEVATKIIEQTANKYTMNQW